MKYGLLTIITLVFSLLFFSNSLIAQDDVGLVLDKKLKKPLGSVNIYSKTRNIGTNTNEKGEYSLKYILRINENDTLNFSHIGYIPKKVSLSDLKSSNYIVELTEEVENLNEVTIVTNRLLHSQVRFRQLSSLKNGLYAYGSVVIDDKIWIIGGDESYQSNRGLKSIIVSSGNLNMKSSFSWDNFSNKLLIYDTKEDDWITSDIKFSKRAYHCANYFNNKIYVLGGKTLSRTRKLEYLDDVVEVFDIKHRSIFVDKNNPHQAVNFASFVYGNNLIVIGGSTRVKDNEEKECSSKAHLLNLRTGYWYELNDMPKAKETKGVLVDSTIYLIGGYNLKSLEGIESYNISTGNWKIEGQLIYAVERPALAYNDGVIYIFENGIVQTYNIATKELKLYSIDLPLKYSELFYANSKLYIVGGSIGDESTVEPSSAIYCIDISEFQMAKVYASKML